MSGFTSAGYENTPDIYLTNQEVRNFSALDDAALTHMNQQYGDVLTQEGVNPRALAGAQRILTHLIFEQDYRAGNYDDAIARYRAREAAELTQEDVPATLAVRRQD